MNELGIDLSYQQEVVLSDAKKEYLFPKQITQFMKDRYKHPAVYRWDIYRNRPEDQKLIYIGEAQQLCPQRINGYLNPGPSQQTNKRIKDKFQSYLDQGLKIGLEIFHFDRIIVGDFSFTRSDIGDKHLRRFLEELLIIYYRRKGFTILNL